MNYRIGIIGYGSIGRRHTQNLIKLLDEMNIAYSIDILHHQVNENESINEKSETLSHLFIEDGLKRNYDFIVISNPTFLHLETIRSFSDRTKHMFIEKPLFAHTDVNIEELELKTSGIYYVACPLRYKKVIGYVKEYIDLSKVIAARAISSSDLRTWRPGNDYRESYSARSHQGGGVELDLIHEWDYLTYLFGFPKKVKSFMGQYSLLDIDTNDIAIYIGEYQDMLVELHLDYFGQIPIRKLELFTQEDTIEVDLLNNTILFGRSGEVLTFQEENNDFYIKEMSYFLECIEGKKQCNNDIYHGYQTLKLVKGELM